MTAPMLHSAPLAPSAPSVLSTLPASSAPSVLDHRVRAPRSPWLVGRPLPGVPDSNLYCFPHSGGLASEYVRWGRELPTTQVYGIGFPGRAGRSAEAPLTAMDELVDALLETTQFTAPYVLFGHSLGALVAFEVTRRLVACGRPLPERLIVSAYPAPHLPREAARIHDKSDAELIRALGDRYQGIPPQMAEDPDLMALFLPAFRADLTLLENYVHRAGAALPVPIEVFGGDRDVVTPEQLEQWRRHSSVSTRVHRFHGGHFYFREDPKPFQATLDALL